jgi:S-formylglutathione hydrolase FrmB
MRAPRVQYRLFESTAAGTQVSYHVFTPPEYDTAPTRHFPVLYWLHGGGGSGFLGIPKVASHFSEAMASGKIPPMILVFPNGRGVGMWVDSKDGTVPMESVVVDELIPTVDANFRTIAAREGRLLEGFSMGGYGAARLGFKHRDLFGAVSCLAGGPLQEVFLTAPRVSLTKQREVFDRVFGNDMDYFRAVSPWDLARQHADVLRQDLPIRVIIGARDEMLAINRRFHDHLDNLQIPHTFEILPEIEHDPTAFLNAFQDRH